MRQRNKLIIYTISVITMFMVLPAFIFDDFESVMLWTWPSIFLGVGFLFLSVWIYEKVFLEKQRKANEKLKAN